MVCHSALRDEKMAQLSVFATSARTYVSTLVNLEKFLPLMQARIVSGHSPPQRLCSLFSFYKFDLRAVTAPNVHDAPF